MGADNCAISAVPTVSGVALKLNTTIKQKEENDDNAIQGLRERKLGKERYSRIALSLEPSVNARTTRELGIGSTGEIVF
jgi:uncharacterized protein (UPF0254 family)